MRNLEENILEFNPEYDIDVHVNPGTRVNNLKDKLRSDLETFEFETAFVLLHVGTNNLQRGLWEVDSKHFVTLY